MFVRFSLVSAIVASLFAISTAEAKNVRDLEYKNPNDGITYGFVGCRWRRPPSVKEHAVAGGMMYSIKNGVAECLPDAPRTRAPQYPSDWTEITNVRCEDRSRANLDAGPCLRQHQGRLQARDGFFTFEHPEQPSVQRPPRPGGPSGKGAGAGS